MESDGARRRPATSRPRRPCVARALLAAIGLTRPTALFLLDGTPLLEAGLATAAVA